MKLFFVKDGTLKAFLIVQNIKLLKRCSTYFSLKLIICYGWQTICKRFNDSFWNKVFLIVADHPCIIISPKNQNTADNNEICYRVQNLYFYIDDKAKHCEALKRMNQSPCKATILSIAF